jgi:hypothetical protein
MKNSTRSQKASHSAFDQKRGGKDKKTPGYLEQPDENHMLF